MTIPMDKLKSFVFSVAMATAVEAGAIQPRATPTQPDWFQTSPDLYTGEFLCSSLITATEYPDIVCPGTVATGAAPFLAEINPAPFGDATYVPNAPLETSEPIEGAKGRNIFHLMGDLR